MRGLRIGEGDELVLLRVPHHFDEAALTGVKLVALDGAACDASIAGGWRVRAAHADAVTHSVALIQGPSGAIEVAPVPLSRALEVVAVHDGRGTASARAKALAEVGKKRERAQVPDLYSAPPMHCVGQRGDNQRPQHAAAEEPSRAKRSKPEKKLKKAKKHKDKKARK